MTNSNPVIVLNSGQKRALSLFVSNKRECLCEGGSRSGKTHFIIYTLIVRALKAADSEHLCCRFRFNHIKQSVWHKTLPDVLKKHFPTLQYKLNSQDFFCRFPNGSRIWFAGLDDKERIEKILGNEYDSIFLNEASQISYQAYQIVKTRLNAIHGLKPKLYIDYNPPSKSHWGFLLFHSKVNPEDKQPLKNADAFGYVKMNPDENKANLSEDYLDMLSSLSEKQRNRFLKGEYSDDTEGALWRSEWIINNRWTAELPTITEMVVAVDPAVSNNENSDETGIVTIGKAKIKGIEHYFVFADDSTKGTPLQWATVSVSAYNEWAASLIIGEVNQGGDLVEQNIRQVDRNLRFKGVRATRGKAVRAEPVSALYEQGRVHHMDEFFDLEDQLCSWVPDSGLKSPDRLDALVWGITHLANLGRFQSGVSEFVIG